LLGRSGRAAFIAGVLGAVAHQGLQPLRRAWAGRPGGPVDFGGAGALDAVVVAGVVAVLLAEAVGEVRERLKARCWVRWCGRPNGSACCWDWACWSRPCRQRVMPPHLM